MNINSAQQGLKTRPVDDARPAVDAIHPAAAPEKASAETAVHHVRPGETVQAIADRHHTTPHRLFQLNPALDPVLRAEPLLAQAHWSAAYLEKAGTMLVPAQLRQDAGAAPPPGAVAPEPAVDDALAAIDGDDTPYKQVSAVQEQAVSLREAHGDDVAEQFVAAYIARHPEAFAEGYTALDMFQEVNDETRALFAAGLDLAYESMQNSPCSSPAALASQLAGGAMKAYQMVDLTHVPTDGGFSALVAQTGNDGLQTDYVRAGLYRANAVITQWQDPPAYAGGDAYYPLYGAYEFAGSLGIASEGSAATAEAVIRFAEHNSFGGEARGVESLRAILYAFSSNQIPGHASYLSFLNAAVPPDTVYYHAQVTAPNTPLGDRESLTLFLAIAGASTDRTGLIEIDAADGSPEATALTARLLRNYVDRWTDPAGLDIAGSGTFGMGTGPFAGVNIRGAMETFFKEAMIDPNENGSYRDALTGFVVERLFQGLDPNSPLAQRFGSATEAAAYSAHLLNLMGLSELSFLKDAQKQDAQTQRMVAFVVGALASVPGAYVAGAPGAVTASKAGQAVLSFLIGKANGTVQGELTDYLAAQGVDAEAARQIQSYVLGGDPAQLGPLFEGLLGQTRLPPEVIADFVDEFMTTLTLPVGQGGGFAEALEAALETLDNHRERLTDAQYSHIVDMLMQLQQALT